MTDTSKGAILVASLLIVGILIGLGIGWKLWSPKKIPETYAREVKQPDGSVILERKPQADAKPAQAIPKGAVVERVVQVTVSPRPSEGMAPIPGNVRPGGAPLPTNLQPMQNPCPPVRVDLTLLRLPDQTRRVIASSPDGAVVGGVDIPVEAAAPIKVLKWAAGGVYGTTAWGDKAIGAFVDRDLAFLRTGAEITKNQYALQARQGWEVRAKLGIRF